MCRSSPIPQHIFFVSGWAVIKAWHSIVYGVFNLILQECSALEYPANQNIIQIPLTRHSALENLQSQTALTFTFSFSVLNVNIITHEFSVAVRRQSLCPLSVWNCCKETVTQYEECHYINVMAQSILPTCGEHNFILLSASSCFHTCEWLDMRSALCLSLIRTQYI